MRRAWQVLAGLCLLALVVTLCGCGGSGGVGGPSVDTAGKPGGGGGSWTVTDLGALGGSRSEAYDINDFGEVVGYAETSAGVWHAFLWQNGTMTDLDPSGLKSFAYGINNLGHVTGGMFVPDPSVPAGKVQHAFLWTSEGGLQDLGIPEGQPDSTGVAINDSDQIVGSTNAGCGVPFQWENGSFAVLPVPTSARVGLAYDINASGQVAGQSRVPDHALSWDAGGGMTDLSSSMPSGFAAAAANGVNGSGDTVGVWSGADGTSHGFLLAGTKRTDIAGTRKYPNTCAIEVNASGQVVGSMSTSGPYPSCHAILWRNATTTDLSSLVGGWTLETAWGINSQGQIVGRGTRSGWFRGFLLTPPK